jgi:hypothetical protein
MDIHLHPPFFFYLSFYFPSNKYRRDERAKRFATEADAKKAARLARFQAASE